MTIKLAAFTKDDFETLIQWIDNEQLMTKWAGNLFSFPLTQKSLEWYVRDTNEAGTSDAFVFKAVNENEEAVGHVSLGSISWANRSARLTRVLIGGQENQGRGYCQQIVKAVLQIGFEALKLHRIELGVYHTNSAAIACYEKAGFRSEGIRRDILFTAGAWWSMNEMSVLEDEWRALQP